ncbi:hypothetical protein [Fibrobacter sp.]|uniref:hypothetical protein n=1 Tax=Fibrobacter sp. TaxID=35828 RepID=UPI003890426F
MGEYKDDRFKGKDEKLPPMDLTNLSDNSLDHINRMDAMNKVQALRAISEINNHTLVAMAGMICQDRIEELSERFSQRNGYAMRRMQELATRSMIFVADRIYDLNKRGGR